jgi:putative radical SAM enzyme (TIGR03279 family)
MARLGVKIREVEEGSVGEQIGLAPGDEILTVNGRPTPDELALKFYLAEEQVTLELRKADGAEALCDVDLSEASSLGVKVEDFRTRTCNNACLFCFIDQLPPGVRPSLTIKDDDYRLSFLHGNYITLTNLPEKELDRIIEQALSPLYISVHATDPEVRTRMLGRRKVDDLERKMQKLIEGGIQLHTQVVLMPGINDGTHLDETLNDLYGGYPGVSSVALVPLGLSEHGRPKDLYTPITAGYCREIIQQLRPFQEKCRREIRRTFAYLADEFYIQGGVPLPDTAYYDDFAQIEDGVGMVRNFLNEFDAQMRRWSKPRPQLRGTLATARLFFPFLKDCAERFNARFGACLQALEIENRFMGRDITVAGLLSGQDLIAALQGKDLGDFVIIPSEAVSRVDGILVDNLSPEHVAEHLRRPVHAGGRTAHAFFDLLCNRLEK